MALTLTVLRCPETVAAEQRRVTGGEFALGRSSENDWPLADPERVLSKRHCMIAFRGGRWQVADISTNGTFHNRDAEPIGRGNTRELRDGDRLRMGPYEFEVRIEPEAEAAWAAPAARPAPPGSPQGFPPGAPAAAGSPFAHDPFGDDPLAPPHRQPEPFAPGPQDHGPLTPDSISLGNDFPLSPTPRPPLRPATEPDHVPAFQEAFRPPTPVPPTLPPDLDDWDLDLSPQPAAPQAPAPEPGPIAANRMPANPEPAGAADPFADLGPFVGPAAATAPTSLAPMSVAAAPGTATPGTATPIAAAPGAAATGAAARPLPAASNELLAAFLRGAGMEGATLADPPATMAALGAAFRELVGGLRQALMARAAVKGEFRIEQTMIRARGNNPLKFSAGDDDALGALLGSGRHVDMTPAEAVADALRDMRLHELAAAAAMQAAVRALVARLDPAPLRAEAERGGGLLAAQRRAHAFELYEKLHAAVTRDLADDFDSVFGKAFARAYEDALHEADERKRS